MLNQKQSSAGRTTTNNEGSAVAIASVAGTNNQGSVGENVNVAMAGEDRSAVQGQEHDNYCWAYQRKVNVLYAVATTASSQQKSAPLDNLPPPIVPIFYDI